MNQVSVKRSYRTCGSCGGEGTKTSYDYYDLPKVICDDCGGSGLILVPLEEKERSRRVRYE